MEDVLIRLTSIKLLIVKMILVRIENIVKKLEILKIEKS